MIEKRFQGLLGSPCLLLNVKGKSDYTLYALLINLLLTIPVVYVGFVFGLLQMTYCVLIAAINYYLVMAYLVATKSTLFFISQIRMTIKIFFLPFSTFLLTIITLKYFDYIFVSNDEHDVNKIKKYSKGAVIAHEPEGSIHWPSTNDFAKS